jgi:hypothetical protein
MRRALGKAGRLAHLVGHGKRPVALVGVSRELVGYFLGGDDAPRSPGEFQT